MAYVGKTYTFDREENFEAFVGSLGMSAESTARFKQYKPNQQLLKDGNNYTLVTVSASGEKKLTFQNGVEFEEEIASYKSKTTCTVNGNTLMQVQKFEDGRTLTYKREYSETGLVVTITSNFWDGTAVRYYNAA